MIFPLTAFLLLPSTSVQAYEEPVAGINIESATPEQIEQALIFRDSEKEVLYRIVEAEMEGQEYECKKNVTSVIINRVHNKDFADTITDVVFEKIGGDYQFSPILDKRYWSVEVQDSTVKAVNDVIKNGGTTEATYFTVLKHISDKHKGFFGKLKYLFTDSSGTSYFK
jgi:N-acetylmuramoyl-L-alanine amidase